ncbi:MAG: hypothetical protein ACREPV_01365 [Lysobacter sp.]
MADGLHILQHSLGLDRYGAGASYRNHFVTGPGSDDYAACVALVEAGLMTQAPGTAISGGMDVFTVTDAGIQHVRNTSPPAPKLSRGKQRYQRYLDADGDLSFGEWLRRGQEANHG